MSLINMVLVLIIVGVLLYLANRYIPMDAKIKNVLNIAVVVFVVLWLLLQFLPVFGIPDLYLKR